MPDLTTNVLGRASVFLASATLPWSVPGRGVPVRQRGCSGIECQPCCKRFAGGWHLVTIGDSIPYGQRCLLLPSPQPQAP